MDNKKQQESFIKRELLVQLKERIAFEPIDDFLEDIPFDKIGIRPQNLPYSFYEIFHHIVYTQKDILDFIENETYHLPNWPDDYWPNQEQPNNEQEWKVLKDRYKKDIEKLEIILQNEENQLSKPVKNASNEQQTLYREVALMVLHLAYHTGQLQIIMRLLGLKK